MTSIKATYIKSKEFVARINGKDPVAWEELYTRYYKALCAYSASLCGEPGAAEDIVQELLLKVWQTELSFTVLPELTAYLYRAVYRNSLAYRRDRDNRTSLLKNLHEQQVRKEKDESAPHEPEEELEFAVGVVEEEIIRRLYTEIQRLPVEQRRIIQLAVAGAKGEEIAQLLGISINTVKTQKYRGYRTLRARLGKWSGWESWILFVLWNELV